MKMTINIIVVLVLSLGSFMTSGCAPYGLYLGLLGSGDGSKEEPKQPPPGQGKTNCGPDWINEKSQFEISDVIPVERVFRKYLYLGCDGEVKKEQWITVKDPKNSYILRASSLSPGDDELSVSAYNRTTCDSGSFKPRDSREPVMTIKMNTSPGTSRMEIDREYENVVHYRFSKCIAYDDTNRCIEHISLEKGVLNLMVDYKETWDNDPKYVDDCQTDLK